jgi:hypothetical protein
MGVALDGQTLTVLKWTESVALIASQYDQWTSGQCKRKQQVYGIVRTYQLDCVEKDVTWANSMVNCFEQKASAGTALAFTSDLPQRAVSNTNVYVTGVDWSAENLGTQNIRNFTLKLQEA